MDLLELLEVVTKEVGTTNPAPTQGYNGGPNSGRSTVVVVVVLAVSVSLEVVQTDSDSSVTGSSVGRAGGGGGAGDT